jgi:hypothetical protein
MSILDQYVKLRPTPQNALDIFKGEWASSLPGDFSALQAGQVPLFQDARILWSVEQVGGVEDKKILELGPLEAGHTYMMEKLGANSIMAVESNTRAYIKCLIIKELIGLKRCQFLCGDFVEYLRENPGNFDICIGSGVLYHMINPAELISLIAKVSNVVFMWTHYYNPDMFQIHPYLIPGFSEEGLSSEYEGFRHTLYRKEYLDNQLNSESFCGGNNPFANWMSREDILLCLQYFGFRDIAINFENPDHPHGSCFCVVAKK